MPLNDSDRAWIKQAIQEALKGRGWGRIVSALRDWSAVAVVLGLGIFVVGEWKDYIKFNTATLLRLNNIENKLAIQSVTAQVSLSPSAFQASLPEIKSVVASARHQRLAVPVGVLDDLKQKLIATDSNAPGYWPAAAELISYQSELMAADFQTLLRPDLPNCTDHDPEPPKILSTGEDRHTFTISSSIYENCRFTLDSPQDDARVNSILQNNALQILFRHCLIVYRGGEIHLIIAANRRPTTMYPRGHPEDALTGPFTGDTLHFESCLLDFELNSRPPLLGQKYAQVLLATKGSEFSLEVATETPPS
jgi:hypothetical protein